MKEFIITKKKKTNPSQFSFTTTPENRKNNGLEVMSNIRIG